MRRLSDVLLVYARKIWWAYTVVLLGIFLVNIPYYYIGLFRYCQADTPFNCPSGQLTVGNIIELHRLHWPVPVIAIVFGTVVITIAVVYWIVGIMIYLNKRSEWTGITFSMVCITLGALAIFGFPVSESPAWLQTITSAVAVILSTLGIYFFFTFPNGKFIPRWTFVLYLIVLVSNIPVVSLPPPWTELFSVGSLLLTVIGVIGVQVYRYRKHLNNVERQQTKWYIWGFLSAITLFTIWNIIVIVVPGASARDSMWELVNVLPWPLLWAVQAFCIVIPIFLYRLWDIDVIINRTLVYGSLTASLALVYVALVIALQALVSVLTGQSQSPFIIVASTLVIAALFQPLRRRIQKIIDRSFYRNKYNAVKIANAFSDAIRDEVDENKLIAKLTNVVIETLHPSFVSFLGVKKSQKHTKHEERERIES